MASIELFFISSSTEIISTYKRVVVAQQSSVKEKRWQLLHLSVVLSAQKPLTIFRKICRNVNNVFKPSLLIVLSKGTSIVKKWLSLCLIDSVRFARCCGKMDSRHLFSYGGLCDIL